MLDRFAWTLRILLRTLFYLFAWIYLQLSKVQSLFQISTFYISDHYKGTNDLG